jgi:hypothetical protein
VNAWGLRVPHPAQRGKAANKDGARVSSPAASRLVAALTHFRTRSSVHIAAGEDTGEDTRAPWPIEKSSQSSTNCFYSTAEFAERL